MSETDLSIFDIVMYPFLLIISFHYSCRLTRINWATGQPIKWLQLLWI